MKTNHTYNLQYLYYIIGGTILWLLLIILAPLLKSSGITSYIRISEYIYFLFEPVCHQIPERSIMLNSESMAVCSRCLSIYFGGFLIILYLVYKKKIFHLNLNWLILICCPAVVDFLLEKFNIYTDIQFIRILTGLLLGIGLSYLVLLSVWDKKNNNFTIWKFNHGKSKIN